jgi:hypothetical protein
MTCNHKPILAAAQEPQLLYDWQMYNQEEAVLSTKWNKMAYAKEQPAIPSTSFIAYGGAFENQYGLCGLSDGI